jgi:nucleotide-binding universal stress UspA family protein
LCTDSIHSRSQQISTDCTALVGDPKDLLIEEIKRQKPDIVAVGQRGLGKVEKFFLGSVSEHLSKHVHSSILIVK